MLRTLLGIVATVSLAQGDPKRDVPDYDGRGNPDAEAGSWALWIPRVALAPLYLTNEVVRRPLGALIRTAERERWADTFAHLFAFGEGDRSVIVPSVRFDLGRLPTIGVSYRGRDLFATGNELRLELATWDTRWIDAIVADRYTIDPADRVQARFELQRSQDNLFFGIGPDVTREARARYGVERLEGSLGYHRRLPGAWQLDADAGVHRLRFLDGDCCGDPSLDTQLARGEAMLPPGYGESYTTAYGDVVLVLDTRRPRPDPGGGVFLHARARPSVDLGNARSWIAYGGAVGGAVDLTGHRRTLWLQLGLDFVDSPSGDAIPFTEYPMLGGDQMPGFVAGWMTDRSTAAAQLGYTWPIWLGLDARTRVTIGNAFGEHLDGFAARRLRLSGDVGVTTGSDQGFELLVGAGTETFAQGAGITSVRVTVGSRRGF